MAAKGLVPLKPPDLVTVLYQLAHDTDEQVRTAATQKADSLPENILEGALAGGLDARVLDFFAGRLARNEKVLQVVILNHATADETIARCAARSSDAISELIATNEQRLLRFPKIIEALYHNKNARMSTVNRAIELAVRNDIVVDGIAAFKEAAAAIQGELVVEETGPTLSDRIFNETLAIGEELEREAGPEAVEQELAEALPQSQRSLSIQAQLGQMTTSEKIRMALLGNASHRSILVRDTNKLVCMAAIKSPGIRDTEVIAYCRNKSLSEEVIRYITDKKEWTKHYSVKLNLIENPKTPMPKAMSFLVHLRQNDLRNIARSKNVPGVIAKAAKQHLRSRA
jgi:hypothetical protein